MIKKVQSRDISGTMSRDMTFADGGGFEPPGRGCRPLVFKTSSFGRSDNHPDEDIVYLLKPTVHNRRGTDVKHPVLDWSARQYGR